MSARFDRDKAREILHVVEYNRGDTEWALDRLEECVQPPRAFVVHSEEEFRGRIDAEAKLARIAALHKPIPDGMGYHDDGTYGSFDGPVCATCGTANEYGVPWPCPTAQALEGGAA